jgi:filamentous hemagglutinin family protein
MRIHWQTWFWKLALPIALGSMTVPGWERIVSAQILPDETLGAETSVVTPDPIKGIKSDRVSGGAIRGKNLFHSFREFNIGEGRGGYFENPAAIENIFSRVTGSNPSTILGTLGVLGNANLFFLNPNGILFGPDARLDLKGSFLATTADSIIFPEGKLFSATNPEAAPLLTVNVQQPIGLELERQEGTISNQGNLVVGEDLTLSAGSLDLQGQLEAGKDLTLQAADTLKIRDRITQPFIAAAGEQLLIQGNQSLDILALNHPDSGFFSGGDLVLRSASTIAGDAHYWSGGNFRIEQLDGGFGKWFSPTDPIIHALGDVSFDSYEGASLQILAGGSVTIPGSVKIIEPALLGNLIQERVILSDGVTVVDIDGTVQPTLDIRAGTTAVDMPRITGSTAGFSTVPNTGGTETSAEIEIGSITNNGGVVFLTNQYQPNSALSGSIAVGSIDATAPLAGGSVAIDSRGAITLNSLIDVSGFDPSIFDVSGDGGDVTLLAKGDITIVPEAEILSFGFFQDYITAGILSYGLLGGKITLKSDADISVTGGGVIDSVSSTLSGTGRTGGNINVMARSLSVTGGSNEFGQSEIGTLTLGEANAGKVMIQASESVSVDGEGSFPTPIASLANLGTGGNAGNVTIETERLLVANGAQVLTRAGTFDNSQGGDIKINASESVELIGTVERGGEVFPSGLLAEGLAGDGGDLLIETQRLVIRNGAQANATTFGAGRAGNLVVEASESVELIGAVTKDFASTLATSTAKDSGATGDAGNLILETKQLTVLDGAQIQTSARNGSRGGDLTVIASDSILLRGTAPDATLISGQSGIFVSAQPAGVDQSGEVITPGGDSGDLLINTSRLTIEDGAKISADTFGLGKGGSAILNINQLIVQDGGLVRAGSLVEEDAPSQKRGPGGTLFVNASESVEVIGTGTVGDEPVNSTLFTAAEGSGDAGNLIIKTRRLIVGDDAEVTASTIGKGEAGRIEVTANTLEISNGGRLLTTTESSENAGDTILNVQDSITLEGQSSGIFASTELGSSGKGGSIFIDPDTIVIRDGAQIAVNSEGSGIGGNIDLQAGSLTLDQGTITAETVSTQGGEISLTLSDLLTLRNHSQITATAGIAQAGGDGGNINIDAPFIIAFPNEDSNITANAFEGDGGNIDINTNRLFGIKFRDQETSLSDITASSEFGQQGEVEINASAIDPTRSLDNLPQETRETEVAQGCQTEGGQSTLAFFHLGRGGVPPTPDDLLSSETVIAEWIPLELADEKTPAPTSERSLTEDHLKTLCLDRRPV